MDFLGVFKFALNGLL